ncbi:MAG: extracellular solute-binding protein [Opitutaceae bacterium]|nr:extracellular solute-binding protein [Opitutaceae bacterium]
MKLLRDQINRYLSPGALVILIIAIIAIIIAALLPRQPATGIPMWISAEPHFHAYKPFAREWNERHPERAINLVLLHGTAMERRMLSGFMAGTPVADIIEPNIGVAAKAFAGPLESVGFLDLTERVEAEGLLDKINRPSFAPYTSRGRIFGLPHDVHPVLLAYRADIVEAAGIDVSQIETWEDYFRVLRPLMVDTTGDGRPNRYLLEAWHTNPHAPSIILLQAGGMLIDENDRPALNYPRNAEVLARLITWMAGPNRVCVDIETYSASGHRQRLDGLAVGFLVPDWMAGSWKRENPGLGGKLKLMPIPAWEKGGRRTSVAGGTMLGFNRHTEHFETAWEFAKELYLSPVLAEQMFRDTNIITPVKALWDSPIFDQPDPFFSGQPSGRLYIEQAPHVPRRPSSPYVVSGLERFTNVLGALRRYADRNQIYDEAALRIEAQRLLDEAQAEFERFIGRNVFLARAP